MDNVRTHSLLQWLRPEPDQPTRLSGSYFPGEDALFVLDLPALGHADFDLTTLVVRPATSIDSVRTQVYPGSTAGIAAHCVLLRIFVRHMDDRPLTFAVELGGAPCWTLVLTRGVAVHPEVAPFRMSGTFAEQPKLLKLADRHLDDIIFNGVARETFSYTLIGGDLTFPDDFPDALKGLENGTIEDASVLTICARTLKLTTKIKAPGTDVRIHCEHMTYIGPLDDAIAASGIPGGIVVVSTVPRHCEKAATGMPGQAGQRGGNVFIKLAGDNQITFPDEPSGTRHYAAFDVRGSKGQDGGDGSPATSLPQVEVFGMDRSGDFEIGGATYKRYACNAGDARVSTEQSVAADNIYAGEIRWPEEMRYEVTEVQVPFNLFGMPQGETWTKVALPLPMDRAAQLARLEGAVIVKFGWVYDETNGQWAKRDWWHEDDSGLGKDALKVWAGRVIPHVDDAGKAEPDATTWEARLAIMEEFVEKGGPQPIPPGEGGQEGNLGSFDVPIALHAPLSPIIRMPGLGRGADGDAAPNQSTAAPLAIKNSKPISQSDQKNLKPLPDACEVTIRYVRGHHDLDNRTAVIERRAFKLVREAVPLEPVPAPFTLPAPEPAAPWHDWCHPLLLEYCAELAELNHDYGTEETWRRATVHAGYVVNAAAGRSDKRIVAAADRAQKVLTAIMAESDAQGRPVGWAPLLSLQASMAMLGKSVELDIPMILDGRLLEARLGSRASRSQDLSKLVQQQIDKRKEAVEALEEQFELMRRAQTALGMARAEQDKAIAPLNAALAAAAVSAKDNETARLLVAGLTTAASTLMQVIPYGQPVLGAAGRVVQSFSTWDPSKSAGENFQALAKEKAAGVAENLGSMVNGMRDGHAAYISASGIKSAGNLLPPSAELEPLAEERKALEAARNVLADQRNAAKAALRKKYGTILSPKEFEALWTRGDAALRRRASENGFRRYVALKVVADKDDAAIQALDASIAKTSAAEAALGNKHAAEKEQILTEAENRKKVALEAWNRFGQMGPKLVAGAAEITNAIGAARSSPTQFSAEIDRIAHALPEHAQAIETARQKALEVAAAIQKIQSVAKDMARCRTAIAQASLAIDALNDERMTLFTSGDGSVLAVLQGIGLDARRRLENAQRDVRRAFEYRLLRQPRNWKGSTLFGSDFLENVQAAVKRCLGSNSDSAVALAAEANLLRNAYLNGLRQILAELVTELKQASLLSTTLTYSLSDEELAELNATSRVTLNFVKNQTLPENATFATLVEVMVDPTSDARNGADLLATSTEDRDLVLTFEHAGYGTIFGQPDENQPPIQRAFRPWPSAGGLTAWRSTAHFARPAPGKAPQLRSIAVAQQEDDLPQLVADAAGVKPSGLLATPSAAGDVVLRLMSSAKVTIKDLKLTLKVRFGSLPDRSPYCVLRVTVEGASNTAIGLSIPDLDGLSHLRDFGLRLFDMRSTKSILLTAPPISHKQASGHNQVQDEYVGPSTRYFSGWRIHEGARVRDIPQLDDTLPSLLLELAGHATVEAVYTDEPVSKQRHRPARVTSARVARATAE